ncbi:MAG: hypothetical protein E7773_12985 [Sphingomonas sp.]|uniref:hypothetical protein n=1 Tax=Sphingomonas sp. TaxID=28214 RepID=UPI00120A8043|nr:hypothetical protein [Sphingomonas sp.]THD35346.1 MAG: hypothetical protein E7773_12985 [Sphingomonas sp.]
MRYILSAAGAASLALASAPAAAAPSDFTMCDGYPAPTKKVDGMSKGTWLWGLASRSEDIRRNQKTFGATAITACDAALADPLLLPQYWLRHAHLLQAKATHQVDAGDADGALKSLAASDALAPAGDVFFERSVILGNRALRAMAYFKQGKKDAALAELDAVDKERPYAGILRDLTLEIRLANEDDHERQRRLIRENARLAPGDLNRLFWLAMFYSDFRTAADIGQEVSFDLPRGRGDWQIVGFADRKYDAIEKRAAVAGARAYALAATGADEASRAAIAEAEADLVEVMAPLPPLAAGEKYKKSQIADHDSRMHAGQSAQAKLDRWKAMIALRGRIGTLTMTTLRPAVDLRQMESAIALPDLLAHVRIDTPADAQTRDAVVKMVGAQIDASMAKENKLTVAELVDLLPRPETQPMVPAFQGTGDGYFLSDMNGFYTKREPGSDYLNIRYGGYVANRATIEELVLLAAAQQTRKAGKDAFLIDSRLFVERTLTTYGMYGINYGTSNNGYEARVRILPVTERALPSGFEHSRWRLIRVADVEASLGGIYRRETAKH